nr:ead/Ea22-like family protein [Klebsiella pneumoniae]
MTDITELAQRLKLEVHRAVSNFNPQMNIKTRDLKELVEALEKAQTISAAAEKLVRCKGRYHSEQNYRALAALFGVKTPDLPPLEHENVHYADAAEMEIEALRQRIAELESCTVKLPQRHSMLLREDFNEDYHTEMAFKADEVQASLAAASIKVETE